MGNRGSREKELKTDVSPHGSQRKEAARAVAATTTQNKKSEDHTSESREYTQRGKPTPTDDNEEVKTSMDTRHSYRQLSAQGKSYNSSGNSKGKKRSVCTIVLYIADRYSTCTLHFLNNEMKCRTPISTSVLLNEDDTVRCVAEEADQIYFMSSSSGQQNGSYYIENFIEDIMRNEDSGMHGRQPLRTKEGRAMPAEPVFTAFLSHLLQTVVSTFENRRILVSHDDLYFVFPVPDHWSAHAIHYLKDSVCKVGELSTESVAIVSEALASLMFFRKHSDLNTNSPMVINLQGRYADVTMWTTTGSMSFRCILTSTDDNCGGEKINKAFGQFLIRVFGAPTVFQFRSEHNFEYAHMCESYTRKLYNHRDSVERVNIPVPSSLLEMFEANTGDDFAESLVNIPHGDKVYVRHGAKSKYVLTIHQEIWMESVQSYLDKLQQLMLNTKHASGFDNVDAIIMTGEFSKFDFTRRVARGVFPNLGIYFEENSTLIGAAKYVM